MITKRLVGSRWSRNSALASGTTRSCRPLMIVTETVICGSSYLQAGPGRPLRPSLLIVLLRFTATCRLDGFC
jgi:hypothetical protein